MMPASLPILSTLIWMPILGGILVLFLKKLSIDASKWFTLVISVIVFIVSVVLIQDFDNSRYQMQFFEHMPWIPVFNIYYSLGVDGISVPLIALTTLITVLVIVAGWEVSNERIAEYFASFLILEGLMIGVFCALDAILFYVFFEGMLIPMFLIIGIWGRSSTRLRPYKVLSGIPFLVLYFY